MLDSEQRYSGQGYQLREAIYHAGRRRLRPILMTALATIFGMLPLAIGVGSGAQLLQPLAIAVIGGVSDLYAAVVGDYAGAVLFVTTPKRASSGCQSRRCGQPIAGTSKRRHA